MKRNKHNILIVAVNLIKSISSKALYLQNAGKRKKNANAYKIELWLLRFEFDSPHQKIKWSQSVSTFSFYKYNVVTFKLFHLIVDIEAEKSILNKMKKQIIIFFPKKSS